VGSDPQSHIRVDDPGIEPRHCQVYPAQGSFWLQNFATATVIDMARINPNETRQLVNKGVFIIGQTYVKFWSEKPAGGSDGGGSASGGADPAALAEAQRELEQARAELEQLKQAGSQSGRLQEQLDEQRRATESAQGELKALEDKLEAATKEADELRQGKEQAEGKVSQAEAELTQAKAKAAADVTQAKEEAQQQVDAAKQEAEQAAEQAKSEAAAELEQEKQRLADEQAEAQRALEATQAALEVLRDRAEARGRDPFQALGAPSEIGEALQALDVPEALRQRLQDAVSAEIDREVIRRSAGPVVPVRGLRVPGSDMDLEATILAAREAATQAKLARELGLHELDEAALDELLAKART
jgi:DNA repair exonuclease SbcCD ATPase subunit